MIGFDYGTSNCSVAVMDNGQPKIVPLLNNNTIASNLYATDRDIITHWLHQQLKGEQHNSFLIERQPQLQKSKRALRE